MSVWSRWEYGVDPERGSPHTGVEVDLLGGAASGGRRFDGARDDTCGNIDYIIGGLSSDEAHSESENGENREPQHGTNYEGSSVLGRVGQLQAMYRPTVGCWSWGGRRGRDFRAYLCLALANAIGPDGRRSCHSGGTLMQALVVEFLTSASSTVPAPPGPFPRLHP